MSTASTVQSRRPAGSPASTGGQYAETARAESGIDLETVASEPGPDATRLSRTSDTRHVAAGRFAPSVLDVSKVEHVETYDLSPVEHLDGSLYAPTVDWGAFDDWAEEAVQRGQACCTMCGQYLRYVNVMHHEDHGTFTLGADCADSVGVAADLGGRVSDLRANRQAQTENLKRTAKFDRLCADDAEFAAALEFTDTESDAYDEFIADVADTVRRTGKISDSQRVAVLRAATRRREWRARRIAQQSMPRIPVPEGKQQVAGTVLTVRDDPNPYSYSGVVFKMLVLDDRGFKVCSTAPAALLGSEGGLRGKRVSFNANLARSDDDEYFGFGKRPTKAAFLPGKTAENEDPREPKT